MSYRESVVSQRLLYNYSPEDATYTAVRYYLTELAADLE